MRAARERESEELVKAMARANSLEQVGLYNSKRMSPVVRAFSFAFLVAGRKSWFNVGVRSGLAAFLDNSES
jgi:hypothetical protein